MNRNFNRRQFLRTAAGAPAVAATGTPMAMVRARDVGIVIDPADAVASSMAARWAATELERALTERGIATRIYENRTEAAAAHLRIISSGLASPGVLATLNAAGVRADVVPEALALCQGKEGVWACGHDARGLTYALLELADRVRHAGDPIASLAVPKQIAERPANTVRSITRLFTSDIEDKPWYNDREMWPAYLSMLAAQRFNRFNLALGIGYDFLTNVTDAYFLFAYPFLLSVPGYSVRVPQLPDIERDRNLEMLRFISEQTALQMSGSRPAVLYAGCPNRRLSAQIHSRLRGLRLRLRHRSQHGPFFRSEHAVDSRFQLTLSSRRRHAAENANRRLQTRSRDLRLFQCPGIVDRALRWRDENSVFQDCAIFGRETRVQPGVDLPLANCRGHSAQSNNRIAHFWTQIGNLSNRRFRELLAGRACGLRVFSWIITALRIRVIHHVGIRVCRRICRNVAGIVRVVITGRRVVGSISIRIGIVRIAEAETDGDPPSARAVIGISPTSPSIVRVTVPAMAVVTMAVIAVAIVAAPVISAAMEATVATTAVETASTSTKATTASTVESAAPATVASALCQSRLRQQHESERNYGRQKELREGRFTHGRTSGRAPKCHNSSILHLF